MVGNHKIVAGQSLNFLKTGLWGKWILVSVPHNKYMNSVQISVGTGTVTADCNVPLNQVISVRADVVTGLFF